MLYLICRVQVNSPYPRLCGDDNFLKKIVNNTAAEKVGDTRLRRYDAVRYGNNRFIANTYTNHLQLTLNINIYLFGGLKKKPPGGWFFV